MCQTLQICLAKGIKLSAVEDSTEGVNSMYHGVYKLIAPMVLAYLRCCEPSIVLVDFEWFW